jgi:hypothetical protein
VQFHEFIVSNLDLMSFERLLPPFESMVKDYGVEPPAAFYLWRPILSEKIRQYDIDLSIQMQKQKLLKGLAASERSNDPHDDTANSSSSTEGNELQDVSHDVLSSAAINSAGYSEANGEASPAPKTEE